MCAHGIRTQHVTSARVLRGRRRLVGSYSWAMTLTRPLYRALEESYKATVSYARYILTRSAGAAGAARRLTPRVCKSHNVYASGDVEEDLQQSDATEPMFLDLLVSTP